MEKQTLILDASVIVKWFLSEQLTDKAIILKKKYLSEEINIIVPELLFIEVVNALRYKNNNEEKLVEISNLLFDINFKVERISNSLLNKAIINSKKFDITIYDSIYISLAQIHGVDLITSDSELFKIPNVLPLDRIS